jgi:hypothetical protein
MEAIALQILERGLDAAPSLGSSVGAVFDANALMDGGLFGSLRAMDHQELAREFDYVCVLHADLPVLSVDDETYAGRISREYCSRKARRLLCEQF